MGAMQAYNGGCHCGALSLRFETAVAPAALQRRACQCSFCRAHGALTISDPDGALRVDAKADALVRYRFGLKTADFFYLRAMRGLCRRRVRGRRGCVGDRERECAARPCIVHGADRGDLLRQRNRVIARRAAEVAVDAGRGVQRLRRAYTSGSRRSMMRSGRSRGVKPNCA